MTHALLVALEAIWLVLREGSPYLLAGLALAGLLHEFVNTRAIAASLGNRSWKSIIAATLLGAPLPLCSCGVIPAAVSLRGKGASREATLAFLVSTPETGIDSLALTWGLLGPVFALMRAFMGIAIGVLVGAVAMFRGGRDLDSSEAPEKPSPYEGVHEHEDGAEEKLGRRLARAARYGFVELFGELAFWLTLGFLASGLLTAVLPENFFGRFLSNEPTSFLVMAAAGTLTYVCASASTPLAAAMIAGGLSPGAALVYLLTGPATNPATVLVVGRLFGRRTAASYLATVFGASLAAGLLVNRLLTSVSVLPQTTFSSGGRIFVETIAAIGVIALTVFVLRRRGLRRDLRELAVQFRDVWRWIRAVRWRLFWKRAGFAGGAVALALWLSTCFFRVAPGERGVVRLLGKIRSGNVGPGIHLAAPRPLGQVELVAVDAIRTEEIGFRSPPSAPPPGRAQPPSIFPSASPSFSPGIARLPFESQFVTGDENVIEVTAVVQYRISDAALFRLGSERAEGAVWPLARSILVEEIGRLPVDAIYSNARGQVEAAALVRLRTALEKAQTGIEPLEVRLLYVHAPDEVHDAFRDVASAAEDSVTSRNRALVDSEGSIRQAQAEANRSVLEADGSKVAAVEQAHGAAASFLSIRREYERAPESTRLRLYLETVERALAPLNKWIKPAGARGLELWISSRVAGAALPSTVAQPEAGESPPAAVGQPETPNSSPPLIPTFPSPDR